MLTVEIDPPARITGSFTLPQGLHAVFGASGTGKTTLFRIIAGLDRVLARIRFAGAPWADRRHILPPYRRALAYVPQYPSLIPHRTLREQTAWVAGPDWTANQLSQWSRLLTVDHLLDRRPPTLSGGEVQRAALLRALATGRPLLLLDEALSQVDRPRRRDIMAALRAEAASARRLVLFSSHDFDEVAEFADTVILVDAARLLDPAPPDIRFRRPPSPELARLMGYCASLPAPSGGHYLIHPTQLRPGAHPDQGVVLTGELTVLRSASSVVRLRFVNRQIDVTWVSPPPAPAPGAAITLVEPTPAPFALSAEEGSP